MPKNINYFSRVKKDFETYAAKRRIVVKNANEALGLSKRAIFALHRDNYNEGEANIKRAEKIFNYLEKVSKGNPKLRYEGAWRSALEEYAEARLFAFYIKNKRVADITNRQIDADIYIGGLCDFTGELVRLAVRRATEKNYKEVTEIKKIIEGVMHNLIQLDLTGYLRTKFDQSKNNMRKIEEITYELSLRSK